MQQVLLPNGEKVEVPIEITEDWFSHRKTGHLDPNTLAPYAKQPRMYMDPTKLAELKASVASQGVRESLVITPMCKAPWAVVNPGDENLPFLIVSGHRRHQTATESSVSAVPVEIRLYNSEKAFNDDAEALNDHRQNLSEIEEGWRYRNKVEAGERMTHLVEQTGHAFQWIQGRIFLTYLCPSIQKKVAPELKRRERLAIGFASALGAIGLNSKFQFDEDFDVQAELEKLGIKDELSPELSSDEVRFALQRSYLSYCAKRGWKGLVSEKFVRTGEKPGRKAHDRYGHHGNSKHSQVEENKKPGGLRTQLVAWIQYLNETNFLDMSETEIAKALSNAVAQDLEAVADRIGIVSDTLRSVAAKKPRYSEEALGDQERLEQRVLAD